jgi:hypothetical protein
MMLLLRPAGGDADLSSDRLPAHSVNPVYGRVASGHAVVAMQPVWK